MRENFVFCGHKRICDYRKAQWAGRPDDTADGQTFVFQESLSDYLKIY